MKKNRELAEKEKSQTAGIVMRQGIPGPAAAALFASLFGIAIHKRAKYSSQGSIGMCDTRIDRYGLTLALPFVRARLSSGCSTMRRLLRKPARGLATTVLAIAVSSCALVPKESVELSTTVGRDIAMAHESHRALADTLFERMKQDVSRFVDDVYAPYQIQFVLEKQHERQRAGNPDNLFTVLDTAMRSPQDAQAQKDVVLVMQAIVEGIHQDVEDYRQQRLVPLLAQQREVTASIERLYGQIERGNAVVTAHLQSVVKVHEAQDELLQASDLEGLRTKIAVDLAGASEQVAQFVDKAEKVEGTVDAATVEVSELTAKLDELLKGD